MSKKIDDVRTEVNVKIDDVKKQNDEVNKKVDDVMKQNDELKKHIEIKDKELKEMLERVGWSNQVAG